MAEPFGFAGQFVVDPGLTEAQAAYLQRFTSTRRVRRSNAQVRLMEDPLRRALGLRLGTDGENFVGGRGDLGAEVDASIADYYSPPSPQPSVWCPWAPEAGGQRLGWSGLGGANSLGFAVPWLEYLVGHFLLPWEQRLYGEVRWWLDASNTSGTVSVRGATVVAKSDQEEQVHLLDVRMIRGDGRSGRRRRAE